MAEDSCLLGCETVSLEWYFQSLKGMQCPHLQGVAVEAYMADCLTLRIKAL
jgi:hypothetical protein